MKTIVKNIIFVVSVALSVIVFVVVLVLTPSRNERICSDVVFSVNDYDLFQFVKESDLRMCMDNAQVNPKGQLQSSVDLAAIEAHIMELSMVKNVTACFLKNGTLSITVTQRVPKFRVKSATRDFYVDTDHRIMSTTLRSAAHVPVVTGQVDESFLTSDMWDFIDYIERSSRWVSAFTQYVVGPGNRVSAVPRVGDFIIDFGSLDRYPQKLAKLATWYDRVPRYYSWSAFSRISLAYRDQVVCTYR